MDNLWMSPCYRQPCVGVHFTWKKDWPAVSALLPTIEERLAPLGARPHWGKLFTMPAEQIQSRYPRLNDFRDLMRACDPHGKFHNAFLERNILASQASTAKSG
jgi:xylitol oxidase